MPIVTSDNVDIKIKAWEVVRYKMKFYRRDQAESDKFNQYVMCCLRGKSRKVVCFNVRPPEQGEYLLKVYAKPEEDILNESDTLDHIATFHITASQVSYKMRNVMQGYFVKLLKG